MSVTAHMCGTFDNALSLRSFRSRQPRTAGTSRAMVGGALMLAMISTGFTAPATAPAGDKQAAPFLTDGGFTRETLLEFDAPPAEPAPLAPAPTASVEEAYAQAHSEVAARRHRRARRHQEAAAQEAPREAVVRASRRRNPVESFVYWWNGFVVRNFHTRNGTVLLDKIGAQS